MKVYLAGPINGQTDEDCKGWRELATAELGAERVLDPMARDYRGREGEPGVAAAIVEQDKNDIQRCTALLVYLDKPSVGTAMEIYYAWACARPVFVAKVSGGLPSPWLVYHSRCISPDLEQALAAVKGYHERRGPVGA